jgi:hypothetical protein
LAQLKGQMDAIEQASIQKRCGIQFRPVTPAQFTKTKPNFATGSAASFADTSACLRLSCPSVSFPSHAYLGCII